MKKILFVLMACVLCLGMVGAAFAQFHDEETSDGNVFTAGTLDLTVNGNNGTNVQLFNLTNLKPGDQPKGTYTLANIGSINGYLDIENIVVNCDENGLTEPEIAAGDSTAGDDMALDNAGELDDVLNLRMFIDYDGDGWISGAHDSYPADIVFFNDLVKNLPASFDLDLLVPAGGTAQFVTEIYDWWAGSGDVDDNQAQSDILTIDLTFTLDQAPD